MADVRASVVGIGAVALLGVMAFAGFQTARLWAQNEIRRVEAERDSVQAERDSILWITAIRDSAKVETERTVDSILGATDAMRRRIDSMDVARAAAQLDVRLLRTNESVENRVREAFPEFAGAMRLTVDRRDPEFPIEYIGFPTRFAEAFIAYRQNAESYEEQRDSLRLLDSLNVEVLALKDSIVTLTELNERTFRAGYDSVFALYQTRTTEYINLLNQPRFKLDLPAVGVIAGSVAVGVLIGDRLPR